MVINKVLYKYFWSIFNGLQANKASERIKRLHLLHNPAKSEYWLGCLNTAKYNCAVCTAKTEIVFNSNIDLHISSRVGTVVQIAFWILIKDIDGWRRFLMMQSQHSEN
jgi:hypothetical protein